MTTYITCDGFHGQSTIDLDPSRVVYDGERHTAWLTPDEMRAARPCGYKGCTCGDALRLLDVRDGGYGDGLVVLRLAD